MRTRVLYLSLLMAPLAACFCRNDVLALAPSPDGRVQLVVYTRDCGATVGRNALVAVLPVGAVPADEMPNVLSIDTGHDPEVRLEVGARWVDAQDLVVSFDQRARIFHKSDRVGAVRVSFVDNRVNIAPTR